MRNRMIALSLLCALAMAGCGSPAAQNTASNEAAAEDTKSDDTAAEDTASEETEDVILFSMIHLFRENISPSKC